MAPNDTFPPSIRPASAPRRPDARFTWQHPAHALALGFGSGLSPKAPGTVGTLWAWLTFAFLYPALFSRWGDVGVGLFLLLALVIGQWACTVTAQHLGTADPGSIVWDEIVAFWAVLWLLLPASFLTQAVAFALFRFFDAAKPGPVGWADRHFKLQPGQAIGWRQGAGILLDDLVAAFCTLLVFTLWRLI